MRSLSRGTFPFNPPKTLCFCECKFVKYVFVYLQILNIYVIMNKLCVAIYKLDIGFIYIYICWILDMQTSKVNKLYVLNVNMPGCRALSLQNYSHKPCISASKHIITFSRSLTSGNSYFTNRIRCVIENT